MKNSRLKTLFFSCFVLLISACCFCFTGIGNSSPLQASAACLSSTAESDNNQTNNYLSEAPGEIPFSLYTSYDNGEKFSVTDYIPTFATTSTSNNSRKYAIIESSIPYIILSSNEENTDLYNSTLYFKFNDATVGSSSTINGIGHLSVQAKVKTASYSSEMALAANIDTSDATNYRYSFAVNLQPLTVGDNEANPSAQCPYLASSSSGGGGLGDSTNERLGGNTDNIISARTGLYTFTITYNYTQNGYISGALVYELSFYVLDYSDYVNGTENPLTFENTDTYVYSNQESGVAYTTDYELYNYNKDNAPIIRYDASKFGLNFTYSLGSNSYDFNYKSFKYITSGTKNGEVTISCVVNNVEYEYSLFTEVSTSPAITYYAKFDLKDFQENLLFRNSTVFNSVTFQGLYAFDLDILIRGDSSTNLIAVDKANFNENSITNLSCKKLAIFGYDLRYTSQDSSNTSTYNKNLALEKTDSEGNDITHTTYIASNTSNDTSSTTYVSIPSTIAVTNQAPLYFHNYGNLSNNYSAEYLLLNYNSVTEEDILNNAENNYFKNINDSRLIPEDLTTAISALDGEFETSDNKHVYTQAASISSDGIWIMKLTYTVSIFIDIVFVDAENEENNFEYHSSISVGGTQYVVFEINNTIQSLNIQGIDVLNNTVYDFNSYTNKQVRVGIEYTPGAFYTPITVSYTYSDYVNNPTTNSLTLKTDDLYTVDGKQYNYYVTNTTNRYTFTSSGLYTVTIRSTATNTSRKYTFRIDNQSFNDVKLYTVTTGSDGVSMIKTSNTLTKVNDEDLYITNSPFTLSWKTKTSGARDYCYVCYMQESENTSSSYSLFKENSSNYWLTNNYAFSDVTLNAESNYVNSYGSTSTISTNSYFRMDGLYYFYVYDQAGNSFSLAVVIDSSQSAILQGSWEGEVENSEWENSYDTNNNPHNIVKDDTILYFGTHKALQLPNLAETKTVDIVNNSYTNAYTLVDIEGTNAGELLTKEDISFDFYDIVSGYSFVQQNTTKDILHLDEALSTNYYLLLPNTSLTYALEPYETFRSIARMYVAVVYSITVENVELKGENNYLFCIHNYNGSTTNRYLNMNYDSIQGQFLAYTNASEQYYVRQNTGTNLDNLIFQYIKYSAEEASYYAVKSLTFDYYQFELDPNVSGSSYPFSQTAISGTLSPQNVDGNIYRTEPINISYDSGSTGKTKPGKYIVTRTYVGGNYNRVYNEATGLYSYEPVTDGGDYYKIEGTDTYVQLFTLDQRVRTYTIYVDRNGIISTTYLDGTTTREVGDNISITLGTNNSSSQQWSFKEFFKTSISGNNLITNKVPIQINIPVSKYFYYSSAGNSLSRVFPSYNFAKLRVVISYKVNNVTTNYTIDGYDNSTGMCTCSTLESSDNPQGFLIFSSAGEYTVQITDNTGYSRNLSLSENINPNTYTYKFEISYSSPSANIYSHILNNSTFVDTKLTNEDGSNNYATNVKFENEDNNDNEIQVVWQDQKSPYLAQVKEITINFQESNSNVIKTHIVDLTQLDKQEIITNAGGNVNNLIDFSTKTNVDKEFVLSLSLSYYNTATPYETFDNQNYYRYIYKIKLSLELEGTYTITLSYVSTSETNQQYYVTSDNSNFANTTYSLKIDRTKPNTNLDRLISAETFLSVNYNTAQFKEENYDYASNGINSSPTSLSYAFGINNTFALSYDSNDTMPYFYVRSYNKYNSEYSSITPDMISSIYDTNHAYYENQSIFNSLYPRFSEARLINNYINIGSSTWYKVNYNTNSSLYSLVASSTGNSNPSGFYEIIEKDYAGNYRSFSVYFTNYSNNYNILQLTGSHDGGVAIASGNAITASEYFTLSSLSSELGWGKITIKNETANTTFDSIILTPSSNSLSPILLSKLNDEFFICVVNTRISITLDRYNSYFPASVKYVNIITNDSAAILSEPTIQESNSSSGLSYNLILPLKTNTSVLYLERLELYVYSGGVWQATSHSYNGNVPNSITGLSRGIYRVVYKDNYNTNTYSYTLYVGEYYINDFSREYTFEKTPIYDETSNCYYTGDAIHVTYEANIYTVKVNGITITGTTDARLASYNCKTFDLTSNYSYNDISAPNSVGGQTNYEVIYYDITDGTIQKTINFTIFDELPSISLVNNADTNNQITSTLEESSSQITNAIVKIDWGYISGCSLASLNEDETNGMSIARLYTKDVNGEYSSFKTISRGDTVSEEGYYRLDITHKTLLNTRSVYFVIQFGDFPLYSVNVNNEEIDPSNKETFNITLSGSAYTAKYSESATAQSIVEILYQALTDLQSHNYLDEIVDRTSSVPKTEYDVLINNLGYRNGAFNLANIGIANITNVNHYYTTGNANIVYNSNIELNIVEFYFKNNTLMSFILNGNGTNPTPPNSVGSNYWTTIYLVYTLTGPIRIELFAVTKVPSNTSFVTGSLYYNSTEAINLSSPYSKVLTNNEVSNSTINLSWNMLPNNDTSVWYKQGNYIYVLDKYGLNSDYEELDFVNNPSSNKNSSTITGSGTHKLIFRDVAGNENIFTTSSFVAEQNIFTLYLIDQVIYYISHNGNNLNPIQYGIFNNSLNLVLDSNYTGLMSNIYIKATRNGSTYSYTQSGNTLTFSEAGKYTVQLDAQYNGRSLNTATYNFTIVTETSSMLAFEFSSIPGYEITKVLKDSRNITNNVVNNGSLFISATDSNSGSGKYTVTLKYGSKDTDVLEFSFLISDFTPTLSCNISYGETTTSEIVITYNASYIYSQLGNCYIIVRTYNDDSKSYPQYKTYYINENSLTSTGASSIVLSESKSYYIQVETANGNTISSFRVNKVDPLNSFAVIAIVVASVAAIILLIVIIKLRTKMRIR